MQVYVTVYSDGPTRVLRLSDEPNITSTEAEQSVLDLAARLKQVRLKKLPQCHSQITKPYTAPLIAEQHVSTADGIPADLLDKPPSLCF